MVRTLLLASRCVKLVFEMVNRPTLVKQLRDFGLDNKSAQIYLTLLTKGPTTPLELSRATGYNRTSVYRYLEELKKMGVAEEIIDEHRTLSQTCSPEQLKLLISQKEAAVDQLKNELPTLAEELSRLQNSAGSPTDVRFYRGKGGLQQLLWNLLKIPRDGEFIGHGYLNWNEVVGKPFAEKLRLGLIQNSTHSREVTNTVGLENFTSVPIYKNNLWQERFVSPKTIEIKHDTYIYNDVFAFAHFHNGELFGVEIHNPEIARTQKQLFEILWKIAEKPKDNRA